MTKIVDLQPDKPLRGVRFRCPIDGGLYYFWSSWQKGVWAKKDLDSTEVVPLFVDDVQQVLNWEVVS